MVNYKTSNAKLALIGLATAVTCILGPIAVALPFSPVPISLGLLAIMLSTCLIGGKLSAISCLVYLLLGLIGLPVLSGFSGGIGILFGPTGGYLLGYLFIPLCSLLFDTCKKGFLLHIIPKLLIGLLLCYLCGTLWLGYQMNLSFYNALIIGVIPYIPADLIKLCIAYLLGKTIRKRLSKAGLIIYK